MRLRCAASGIPETLTACYRLCCAGVSSFDVNLDKQEVLVNGTIPYDDVLAKIKKTGKEVGAPATMRAMHGAHQVTSVRRFALERSLLDAL